MQKGEFSYYEKNKQKFEELYEGKYLVISGRSVLGIFSTHAEAFEAAIKRFPVGEFIIKNPAPVTFG